MAAAGRAAPERHRARAAAPRRRDRRGRLRAVPRHRRVHPDRRGDQRHRRRGHGRASRHHGAHDAPRRSPCPAAATDGLARDSELLSAALNGVLEEQAGRVFATPRAVAVPHRRGGARGRRRRRRAARRLPARRARTSRSSRSSAPARWSSSSRTSPRSASACAAGASTTRPARSSASRSPRPRRSCARTSVDIARADVAQLQIEHVLTAHPTEATRRSVLDHQWDVAALLDQLDDPRTGLSSRRALLDELREVLTIWWQTDEVRRVRPHVEDEVRRNLFFFEAVLFDAVPAVLDEIEHALGVRLVQPVLSYGSWTGGDMDGHPEVGADTLAQRARAAPRRRRCGCCASASTGSRRRSRTPRCACRCPRSSLALAGRRTSAELPSADVLRRPHREWEPLRTKLGFVRHRLTTRGARAAREPGYADAQALRRDLELVLAHLGSAPRRDGRDPAAAVAGRRVRLPPRRASTCASRRRRRARGRRRRCCPASRAADEAARAGAADRGARLRPARDRARPGRRGRRAAARARHGRAVAPRRTGRRPCRRS